MFFDPEMEEAQNKDEEPKYYKKYRFTGDNPKFVLYKPSVAKLMAERTGYILEGMDYEQMGR